jgi:uncharacterized protein involved in exopolysaccharide biosynthesis
MALGNAAEAKTTDAAISGLRGKAQEALERLNEARRASDAALASTPIASLENEVRAGFDLRFRLEGDLSRARSDLAEYAAQQDTDAVRRQVAATQARIASIEKQKRDLAAELERQGSRLDASRSRRDALDAEVEAARNAYEASAAKLSSTLWSPQVRGQRLRMIDPGTVPRQPASPNLWLNTVAAFFASLIAALSYLVMRFGYVRLQREKSGRVYSVA